MIGWTTRALLVATLTIPTLTMCLLAKPPSSHEPISPRANALDLLLLTKNKSTRLELKVVVDGKNVSNVWDETFARLFDFLDRNSDGFLDRKESSRLPSSFAVRQVLWGQFILSGGSPPPFADLDANADGKVSKGELADYYRREGLGGVLVGVGRPPSTDRLSDALLKHLDTNKDGMVSEAEWKVAAEVLRKRDANDDELIGPGELVTNAAYPGALASSLLVAPAPQSKPDSISEQLPLILLPLRTADTHWCTVAARRRNQGPTKAEAERWLSLRKTPPGVAWGVGLAWGQSTTNISSISDSQMTNARLTYSADGVVLVLRADEGKLPSQTTASKKRYVALFAASDADGDGILSEQELGSPQAVPFKQLLSFADRNEDGQLDQKELLAWLSLQEQIARGHVLLSILDHGTGLFELLDADHDGSLSVRELRTAWQRLQAAGCIQNGRFDRSRLPRHLIAAISRGHPQSPLGPPVRFGPAWFRAMDRNGDGDVSRSEFTGPAALFGKLDLDNDGLLSAEEARAATSHK